VLAPFTVESTQRVAMLMAEIERTENGDSGRARAWTLRAVRALHDPVWTADGYVSDRWRPVSPVTGRIDAFQWQTPLAALPSDRMSTIESEILRETVLAPPRPMPTPVAPLPADVTPPAPVQADALEPEPAPGAKIEPEPVADEEVDAPVEVAPPPKPEPAPPPLFRDRMDIARDARPTVAIPAVIPIIRPPDDPGVDEADDYRDEFAELNAGRQQGGWRGFLRRWGG
jgi:HemY protein